MSWLIEDTWEDHYRIFFSVKENGPFSPPEYMGPVGNGDGVTDLLTPNKPGSGYTGKQLMDLLSRLGFQEI